MPPAKLGLVYSHTGLRRFLEAIGVPRTRELFLLGRNDRRADGARRGASSTRSSLPSDLEEEALELGRGARRQRAAQRARQQARDPRAAARRRATSTPTSSASSSSCAGRASPPRTCARASARSPRSARRAGAGGEGAVKIVTWNVNSLGARLPRVLEFLEAERARRGLPAGDEDRSRTRSRRTSCAPPATRRCTTAAGAGRASRSSRARGSALDDPSAGLPGELDADEARWIEATVGGLRVASVYVTNGRAVGTPTFDEKLAFLDAMATRAGEIAAGARADRSWPATSTSRRPTSTSTTRPRSSARRT